MIGFNLHKVRRHFIDELARRFPMREAEQLMRVLLEDLFGIDWKRLLMEPALRIEEADYARLKNAVGRLLEGVPVQYVTGMAWFDGINIKVNPSVLIPRPETEELVQRVADGLAARLNGNLRLTDAEGLPPTGESPLRVWDLCTGSGCIAIALAKRFPQVEVKAIDVSPEAIALARENALAHGVEVEFVVDDLLCPQSEVLTEPVDVVVSNPPYVRESERAAMESNVLDHEPSLALFVPDDDPLRFYRVILELAKPRLTPEGSVWFEINEAMGEELSRLCQELGFQPAIHHDFADRPRFLTAKAPFAKK